MATRLSFFDKLDISTENIRYLLWQNEEIERDQWVQQLSSWLGGADLARCQLLLGGDVTIDNKEGTKIIDQFPGQFSEEDLHYHRLLERDTIDLLANNVRFLTDMLNEDTLKSFASKIGVSPVTISRWRGGDQHPHRRNQVAFASYFGLPYEVNLEADAIFLYPGPLSDAQMRNWMHGQINQIHPTTLRKLFPALECLLSSQ